MKNINDPCITYTGLLDDLRYIHQVVENLCYSGNRCYLPTVYGYLNFNNARIIFYNNNLEDFALLKRKQGAMWLSILRPSKIHGKQYRKSDIRIDSKEYLTELFFELTGFIPSHELSIYFRSLK